MIAEILIERVGLEGQGVGYDTEGNIYFVPGTLPGDKVKVQAREVRRKYRDAELVELVAASPERTSSPCSYFPQCGGCDWLHWDYEGQLRGKDAILQHVLERGGLSPERKLPMIPAQSPLGYRNRIQLRQQGTKLGFFKKRSHELVDVERCAVVHPALNDALGNIRREMHPSSQTKKIELLVGTDGKALKWEDRPHSFAGFRQINDAQNELLRAKVSSLVANAGAKNVLEVYAGDGNLTYAILPHVDHVVAVDSNEKALEIARSRKKNETDSDKVIFLQALADRRLGRKLPEEFRSCVDTLVIDPPRQGTEGQLEHWLLPSIRVVVYVSCSPVTFSKDVQVLKRDFDFVEVQGIDMFPHTRHIEFVSLFIRRS